MTADVYTFSQNNNKLTTKKSDTLVIPKYLMSFVIASG